MTPSALPARPGDARRRFPHLPRLLGALLAALALCAASLSGGTLATAAVPEEARASQQACGGGDAVVTGSQSAGFTTTYRGTTVYQGDNYIIAIWEALGSLTPGRTTQESVSVMASGWIGNNTIDLPSHTSFEVCGTMGVGSTSGRGAIEAFDATDVAIPHLTMTGSPWFGMHFGAVRGLHLGQITLTLDTGLGIRFDRQASDSTSVVMDHVFVSGTDNHGVETWNINGLDIGTVIARDVGYAGLLLNNTRNARIGLVDGHNVATGTGYATFRMANTAGRAADGGYATNVVVDRVVAHGGGRGIFCVSQSGGLHIGEVELSGNGGNSVLIENCYNVTLASGTVDGGGEVRISSRSEFPVTRDVSISLDVNGTAVRESPCGQNISWQITGDAPQHIC
ncbi:right-handed parallel beta-helix repeat-containing protein [Nesterenkonia xinjiangensis]|uniref:Parallel beta helix pectate lyase-like protein n=1 Tax=Nesterenkonia xinjiangensis TaxID=225327 RepID=A0A7Z0GKQ8_9MICC|nr:right-handed parallel beta-helix repeat-containing protein [Nesterenkonia xinjiangensis]NYJ76906.1 hypothetical protein [Nesterenkonia xinjiangensis]